MDERIPITFRSLSIFSIVTSILLLFCGCLVMPLNAEEPGRHGSRAGPSLQKEVAKGGIMTDKDKLTDQEGSYLISVARKTIEDRLFHHDEQDQGEADLSPKFSERRGTFVTLTINDNLRGCIGHIIPQESLIEGIRVNAINAAFRDPRFRPLSKGEWEQVKVEISILTDPKPLTYSDSDDLLNKLRPGVHGVIIKKGMNQATFLPQVWDQLPDKQEFLTHLCLKAGMDGYVWKKEKLEVLTYQVQAFEEH